MSKEIDTNHHMIVFKGKNIRRVLHNDEWWFVVKDIVEALIDTSNSTDYIKKMRVRDSALSEASENPRSCPPPDRAS